MSTRPLHTQTRAQMLGALFLGASLVVAGCKSAPAPQPGVRNSDGSITNADGSITYPAGTAPAAAAPAPTPTAHLNPDGSTTNPDGSVTYPAGSNRAGREIRPAPEPRREERAREQAPAPATIERAPAAPASAERVIPSGTTVRILTTETLSASRNEPGDSFHGTLSQPIRVNGEEFFKQGTPVSGTVVASKRKGRFKGAGDLGIELSSIGGVHVGTTEYEAESKGQGKRTGAIIGGGGGLGALIGGLAGGGKGALIGGLAGAGAGTAASAYTGNRDVVIPSESPIAFTLTAPITLR